MASRGSRRGKGSRTGRLPKWPASHGPRARSRPLRGPRCHVEARVAVVTVSREEELHPTRIDQGPCNLKVPIPCANKAQDCLSTSFLTGSASSQPALFRAVITSRFHRGNLRRLSPLISCEAAPPLLPRAEPSQPRCDKRRIGKSVHQFLSRKGAPSCLSGSEFSQIQNVLVEKQCIGQDSGVACLKRKRLPACLDQRLRFLKSQNANVGTRYRDKSFRVSPLMQCEEAPPHPL
jgi:hypothetical protein